MSYQARESGVWPGVWRSWMRRGEGGSVELRSGLGGR